MNSSGGEVDVGAVGLGLFVFLLLLTLLVWGLFLTSRKIIRGIFLHKKDLSRDDRPVKAEVSVALPKESPYPTPRSTYDPRHAKEAIVVEPMHKMVKYNYSRREYIMSQYEREFYLRLFNAVGRKYLIFPQIHLDKVLDHRVKYQYH